MIVFGQQALAQVGGDSGLDLVSSPLVDALYVPGSAAIDIVTVEGGYVHTIPTQADTGSPCKGFAFSQNYTKLIVAAGSNLYWYAIIETAGGIIFDYQGLYASIGYPIDGLVQSRPAVGDFIVQGADTSNRASYVNNAGSVDGPHNTGLTLNGWQVGNVMYVGVGDGTNPIIIRKAVDNGDPNPIGISGAEVVSTYTGGIGAYIGGLTEVYDDGTVFQSATIDDAWYVAILDSGGALIDLQTVTFADYDPVTLTFGSSMGAQSYLHGNRSYMLHNSDPFSPSPRIWLSTVPLNVDGHIDVIGYGGTPPQRAHAFKWLSEGGGGGVGPGPGPFPGLGRTKGKDQPFVWGPPL